MSNEARYERCPRCGRETLRADRPALNALSRTDNDTYICSPCGGDEAARDFGGQPPIPPNEWPIGMEMMPLYPEVTVELTGTDGNAFAVIGTVRKALRYQIGGSAADAFIADAFESSSYDEVLATVHRYVDVV